MNRQRNVNSTLPRQLPHTFSYIVAILIHNYFESPNRIKRRKVDDYFDVYLTDGRIHQRQLTLTVR
jgi:hypothetical protein